MGDLRKITVNLPSSLIDRVTAQSGKGVTEAIREALEAELKRQAIDAFIALRGKVTYDQTWQELRGKDEPEKAW